MAEGYSDTAKVYVTEKLGKLSIRDMLAYVEEHGVMRVSDLHIKVGTPPAYRIDGNLVKLKGITVTPELAAKLIYPLLSGRYSDILYKGTKSQGLAGKPLFHSYLKADKYG